MLGQHCNPVRYGKRLNKWYNPFNAEKIVRDSVKEQTGRIVVAGGTSVVRIETSLMATAKSARIPIRRIKSAKLWEGFLQRTFDLKS